MTTANLKDPHMHRSQRTGLAWILFALIGFFVAVPVMAIPQGRYVSDDPAPDRFVLASDGSPVPMVLSPNDHAGVHRVAKHLRSDLMMVTGEAPDLIIGDRPSQGGQVIIGTIGTSALVDDMITRGKLRVSDIEGKWETFVTQTVEHPWPGIDRVLVIAGSDKRGTIYGMFDLSEQIGVTPWAWWADVPAQNRPELHVLSGRHSRGEPKVKYRGIFLNDEAPALSGWAYEKYGGFNKDFYQKVFELILRLRGNYLWPAMWGRSLYDDDPLSAPLADEYGVVLGTSHHEPLMRAHVEWQRYGDGAWNYAANEQTLREFWEEGVRRMGQNESIVTIGMRGDGDEAMSEEADIALLERIVRDQREIIEDVTGKQPEDVPQIWALYKEVQEYYDRGMRVPDDVTLLLCDDNWGNIRKLPRPDAAPRSGGYGIYYHFDYVGGPRNYKWLNTRPLPRVWEQMHLAYQHGVDRIWIVNVGDLKPMELPIEFFLDYAWDPDQWPAERLPEYTTAWAAEQFPDEYAPEIGEILEKYTKYNSRHKPEMLGPDTYSLANYNEFETVVSDYKALAENAKRIGEELPEQYADAYFQLVLYPVSACANLNQLYYTVAKNRLYAEQGRAATNKLATKARELFMRDAELARQFNEDLADGKWSHMMDQTNIGYTYWQQPDEDTMPEVREISIPEAPAMGVAIEGATKAWPGATEPARLPDLSPHGSRSRWLEIFNRGSSPYSCEISADKPWVRIGPKASRAEITDQQRFEVSVDWDRAPAGDHQATIAISGPGGTKTDVHLAIHNPSEKPRGFVESDGTIAMDADAFTRAVNTEQIWWQRLPDHGRTGSAVTPFPVTASRQEPEPGSPCLEYDIHLLEPGEIEVHAFVSPTIDYYNRDGMRYAVSIDNNEPQVVNLHTDTSEGAWEQRVGQNINRTATTHRIDKPGKHTLKIWMVDPGVVFQKLVVDAGGLRESYLGPPPQSQSSGEQ